MKMKKKASLNLSVNAIVILVLAVVLLGLALAFIRGMFGKMTSKMGEIVDITQIEAKPTADMPITMPNRITIKDRTTVQIGFYNRFGNKCNKVNISGVTCYNSTNQPVGLLTISAPEATGLDSGKSVGFNAILKRQEEAGKEVGSPGDMYVCSLTIECTHARGISPQQDYETKQFYVEIKS